MAFTRNLKRLTATLEAACWNGCEAKRATGARFDAVLIDETQDFCLEWLKLGAACA